MCDMMCLQALCMLTPWKTSTRLTYSKVCSTLPEEERFSRSTTRRPRATQRERHSGSTLRNIAARYSTHAMIERCNQLIIGGTTTCLIKAGLPSCYGHLQHSSHGSTKPMGKTMDTSVSRRKVSLRRSGDFQSKFNQKGCSIPTMGRHGSNRDLRWIQVASRLRVERRISSVGGDKLWMGGLEDVIKQL